MIQISDTDFEPNFQSLSELAISAPLHWIDFVRDGEGEVKLTFTCRGDKTSPCHIYPECLCEVWGFEHEHPSVPHVACWLTDWFSNHDEGGASYEGADAENGGDSSYPPITKSGYISTVLADEWVEWEWARIHKTFAAAIEAAQAAQTLALANADASYRRTVATS